MKSSLSILALVAALVVSGLHGTRTAAQTATGAGQGQGRQGRANPPRPDPTKPQKLDITDGSKARFKVQEQLAGISFGSEAVGTTEAVTGTLVVQPDGSIDSSQSKISVDLRTLKSDQELRDGYIKMETLQTDKFPMAEFVPKRAQGLPVPLPAAPLGAQAGFQLIGDMTVHGVTKPVTWNVVATFTNAIVAGRATTTLLFADFGMSKPSLARLLSVDDKIQLEVEIRCRRSSL